MDLITWHHVGCPDSYKQEIDQKGYVTCDCGHRYHILDGRYNCGNQKYHSNRYDPVTSRIRLRKILAMLSKVDGYDDEWIDTLETNILQNFDDRGLR